MQNVINIVKSIHTRLRNIGHKTVPLLLVNYTKSGTLVETEDGFAFEFYLNAEGNYFVPTTGSTFTSIDFVYAQAVDLLDSHIKTNSDVFK